MDGGGECVASHDLLLSIRQQAATGLFSIQERAAVSHLYLHLSKRVSTNGLGGRATGYAFRLPGGSGGMSKQLDNGHSWGYYVAYTGYIPKP